MAKKASQASKSSTYDMEDLNSFLVGLSDWGGTLDDDKFSKINDWISTGNYALNALISGDIFKGIPSGRITTLAAPESTGKTFLALNIAREAQKKGYYVIWFDTENAFDAKQAVANFGIEPTKLRLEKINTITELTIYCKKLTARYIEAKKEGLEIPKILMVVDSIGNLASYKEVQDILEGEKKVDMSRAKDIKAMFRILTTDLGKLDIPMVAINHVYANTASFFGGNSQSGGCLTAENEVLMADDTMKNIDAIRIGDFVQTINGDQEVIGRFHFIKKPIVKLKLSNGQTIRCTKEHKFLIGFEGSDMKRLWAEANDLKVGDIILHSFTIKETNVSSILNKLKIESKEDDGVEDVYDITVNKESHYILKNGVITHNSGLKYLGSVNVELSKAQIKDGNDRVGITVTAKLEKARFSAPYRPIKFQIRFDRGMNKYIGLEAFMDAETFEVLGFGPGKVNDSGKYTYADTEFPNYWALKDENKNTTRKTIYKNSFFNQERLERLNEIVKMKLSYKHAIDEDENEELFGDDDE